MKFKFVYTLFGLLLMSAILMSNANGRAFSQGKGNTGAPGDEMVGGSPRTCRTCHASGTFSPNVVIEMLDPSTGESVTEYVPGTTYNMLVKIEHTGSPQGFGFQMVSLLDNGDTDVNGWSSPAGNVRIATASSTGRSYAEQLGMSATNEFEVQWTAPAAGSGSVTFYAAGNAVNSNQMSAGDGGDEATLQVSETVSSTNDLASEWGISAGCGQGCLNIIAKNNTAGIADLQFVSLSGQVIAHQQIDLGRGLNSVILPSDLPAGIYVALLQNEEGKKAALKVAKW